MRGTRIFEKTIRDYLDKRAKEDELFAVAYAKEGKSISECCNYILERVSKSGRNGFTDEEIYGMAVHYYDEDNIKAEAMPSNVRVVVNHKEGKEEEKQPTEKKETKPVQMEQKKQAPAAKPKKSRKQMEEEFNQRQLSLFEL